MISEEEYRKLKIVLKNTVNEQKKLHEAIYHLHLQLNSHASRIEKIEDGLKNE